MEFIKEYLGEVSIHIMHCQATRQAKLAVFKMQVIPKVMYTVYSVESMLDYRGISRARQICSSNFKTYWRTYELKS